MLIADFNHIVLIDNPVDWISNYFGYICVNNFDIVYDDDSIQTLAHYFFYLLTNFWDSSHCKGNRSLGSR